MLCCVLRIIGARDVTRETFCKRSRVSQEKLTCRGSGPARGSIALSRHSAVFGTSRSEFIFVRAVERENQRRPSGSRGRLLLKERPPGRRANGWVKSMQQVFEWCVIFQQIHSRRSAGLSTSGVSRGRLVRRAHVLSSESSARATALGGIFTRSPSQRRQRTHDTLTRCARSDRRC